jgi:hypothetical protein
MLRGFFASLEEHAFGVIPARDLLPVGADALRSLRAEGIVTSAPRAETFPCGALDCARVVCESDGRLVAACAREPPECETVAIAPSDLEQAAVSIAALVRVLRRELRIDPPRRAPFGRVAGEGIANLGEQGQAAPRDVFLVLRPRSPAFAPLLALREHAPRPTLVLVPTLASLETEVLVAHAAGAKVEIDALAELLAVGDGRIEAVRRLRAPPPRSVEAPRTEVAARPLVPRPRRWEDMLMHALDGETVIVRVGWRTQRLTHIDLGMARRNRKPRRIFLLLLAVCAGGGGFRWRDFGKFEAVKQLVTQLRKALSAAFGIEADPFREFSYEHQWRAKFGAGVGELEALPRAWEGETRDDGAESAWAVAFEDWEGRAAPGKGKRKPAAD